MKNYYGITNPLIIALGVIPIYFSVRILIESPILTNSINSGFVGFLILFFLLIIFIILPAILLVNTKIVAINSSQILTIYPLRFIVRKYSFEELKSVYQQLNNSGHKISFQETHIYFGNERRFKFNTFEILNFKGLTRKLKSIEKAANKK